MNVHMIACLNQRLKTLTIWRVGWLVVVLGLGLAGAVGHAGSPPPPVTNLWTFTFSKKNSAQHYISSTATPAVAPDGRIYVGCFAGIFFAINPDGTEKWEFQAGREIHSSAAIAADGTVYFGSRDWNFYALTPAGKVKWIFPTGAWVDSSPAIAADGTIYVGSWDKNIYALNPNGSLKWKFATGAVVDSSPAIGADGTIYFGSHDKKFYALTATGKARWTFLTGGEIVSSPAIGADGTVFFSSLDGNLYALNPDGTERWRMHTGGATEASPVVDETGRIFLPVNKTTASFTADGQRSWTWPSDLDQEVPPAVATGQIYISRPWRVFDAVSLNQQWLWNVDLPDNLTSAPVIAANGTIYVCCNRWVCAIQPPQPAPPAKSSWPMFRANVRHTGRVGDK